MQTAFLFPTLSFPAGAEGRKRHNPAPAPSRGTQEVLDRAAANPFQDVNSSPPEKSETQGVDIRNVLYNFESLDHDIQEFYEYCAEYYAGIGTLSPTTATLRAPY